MKIQTTTICLASLTAFALVGCIESAEIGVVDDTMIPISVERIQADFDNESMPIEPKFLDCTLSEGAQAQCIAITFAPAPAKQKIGPFCPRNIADGPEKSGIWFDGGNVYDADGAFIANLPEFYDDDAFLLYDKASGDVRVTDTKLSCEAAARPDVAEEFQNYCVECQVDYVEEGTTLTYVIPVQPVSASSIAPRVSSSGVGISFGGARLDAPAPTDAILAAHTLAPFDDCGGHVNPNVGYHLHAATDCLLQAGQPTDHAIKVGLAMDGYAIFAEFLTDGSAPSGLDQCRGHTVQNIGYHYHANSPGSNAILPCHTGQTGCSLNEPDGVCDASKDNRSPPGGGPSRERGE